jgi:hypothetical protein
VLLFLYVFIFLKSKFYIDLFFHHTQIVAPQPAALSFAELAAQHAALAPVCYIYLCKINIKLIFFLHV